MIVLRAIDKWDRLGKEGVEQLLKKGRKDESGDFTAGAGLDDLHAEMVLDFAMGSPTAALVGEDANLATIEHLQRAMGGSEVGLRGVEALREIAKVTASLGLSADDWTVDTSIVRGLEYYTGPVFEAALYSKTGSYNQFGSVGGGGRYDGLVSRFRGEDIPATGFSVGVSRLLTAMDAIAQDVPQAFGPVVVLAMDKGATAEYFAMAAELRNAGVAAEVYLGSAGMKAQLKYADKRRAPVAVIVGGDELAAGTITAKNLVLGDKMAALAGDDREEWNRLRAQVQVTAPRAELAATVKRLIAEAEKLAGDAS